VRQGAQGPSATLAPAKRHAELQQEQLGAA